MTETKASDAVKGLPAETTKPTTDAAVRPATVVIQLTHVRCTYMSPELVQYYTTVTCTFCGGEHNHGSNTKEFDPTSARLANCGKGRYGLQQTPSTTYSTQRYGDCILM
ncbi:MAG: hypothetical protein KGL39_13010 [Patescibacteria group bacterium]|nr:hypothetical protein [Patescibacteria group bacterium]